MSEDVTQYNSQNDFENDLPDEFEYQQGETDIEIISACFYSLSSIECYDYGMCSKTERKMIDEVKMMSLKLLHKSLKNIYEANIEQENE